MVRRVSVVATVAIGIAVGVAGGRAQAPSDGPYKVLKTAKVGGAGGFDYVYADVAGRRLYIPRGAVAATETAPARPGRVTVFNLDTLAPAGEIADTRGNGAASIRNRATASPAASRSRCGTPKRWPLIKTIDVAGQPRRHSLRLIQRPRLRLQPRRADATVIDSKDGSVLGTIDLGGAPEQAVADGKGPSTSTSPTRQRRRDRREDDGGDRALRSRRQGRRPRRARARREEPRPVRGLPSARAGRDGHAQCRRRQNPRARCRSPAARTARCSTPATLEAFSSRGRATGR